MSLNSRMERASRFLDDTRDAFLLPPHKMVIRHNRALAAVRALWVSRRKWQVVAAELQAERDNLRLTAHTLVQQRNDAETIADDLRAQVEEFQSEAQLNGGAQ